MAQHEVDALIEQVEKITAMARGKEALTEEQRSEFRLSETLMLSVLSHRGPGCDMTEAQAVRLGAAMRAFREAMVARGVARPSPEELEATARQLREAPPRTRH